MKKEDSKISIIIAGAGAALILFAEIFWRSQFAHASTGLHILNFVLIAGFVASMVWMFVNDIDALPRALTMILAVAVAVLVGVFGSQTAIDPQSWLK